MNPKTNERNYGIDLYRIVCMVMIPCLHIMGWGGVLSETAPLTWNNEIGWLLEIIAYSAPDGYALISGYVSYGKKQTYSSIIYRMIQATFYTVVTTALFSLSGQGNIGLKTIIAAILPVPFNVYWYFTSFFCMWFFIPVLNLYVERTSQDFQKKVIFWLLMIYSLLPTLFHNDFSIQNWGYSSVWLSILYVIGAYIRKYGLHRLEDNALKVCLHSVLLIWISKIAIEIVTYKFFGTAKGGGYLIQYTSPFVVLCAVCLLLFFSKIEIKGSWLKVIRFFSPLTFGAYLVQEEPLIRNFFIKDKFCFLAHSNPFKMIFGVVLFALVIWFIGSMIDWLRKLLFNVFKVEKLCQMIDEKIPQTIKI